MISKIADAIGVNSLTVYVLLIAIAVIAYVIFLKNPSKKNKKYVTVVIGGVVVLMLFSSVIPSGVGENTVKDSDWQRGYLMDAETQLVGYDDHIANTVYYDYDSTIISAAANSIAESSDDPRDAIENAMKYVYGNVEYKFGEADSLCLDGAAPKILQSGSGQCDTQSLVLISLLRKMGVAAKPAGGCIMLNPGCRLQSIFINSGFELASTPKYEIGYPFDPTGEGFSRGVSREGGLHAWVMAWTPDEGWLTLEVTTGLVADTKCYNYHVELLPDDSQKSDICVSKNWNYASACQSGDLDTMNDQGLALVNEVEI